MTEGNAELRAVTRAAMWASGAMIAAQIGAKATRDAFFLSHFDIESLPVMLVAAAVASVAIVLTISRLLSSMGPARLVPRLFAASGVLLLLEWGLAELAPKVAAVVVYVHVAGLGAVLISAFWSLLSERLDPRSAKRQIGRIGGGSTLGGVIGGLLAERVAVVLSVPSMLPILALLHLFVAWRVRGITAGEPPKKAAEQPDEPELESGFRVLRKVSYLRNLATLVTLGTISAAFLDYVFKAQAVAAYPDGDELLRFFAIFYTAIGVGTFVVQTTLSSPALQKLGLARTVASLPGLVTAGGLGALFFPGLGVVGSVRGAESVVRSSLYRSSYEVLFTPIPPKDKRATKTLIDVGCERLGDALGGGVVKLVLVVAPVIAHRTLLGLAVTLSVAALFFARRLHYGYVRALEESLLNQAIDLDLADSTTRSMVLQTLGALNVQDAMTRLSLASGLQVGGPPRPGQSTRGRTPTEPHPVARSGPYGATTGPTDRLVEQVVALRSGEPDRVRAVLEAKDLNPTLVTHILPLLAWDEVCELALTALGRVADRVTGQLVDALLARDEEFAIRRRIPRALCKATNSRALEGLMSGLADRRFEVRFQCGRGLRYILDHNESLSIPPEQVEEAVLREVHVDRRVWRSHRLLDRVDDDPSPFVDEVLRERANRSLEHVFTLLSLFLPRQPLNIAFRGLHTSDRSLRGTALEYLESVLPSAIRDSLWPFLEPERVARPATTEDRQQALDRLMRSNRSIQLNLQELRAKNGRNLGD